MIKNKILHIKIILKYKKKLKDIFRFPNKLLLFKIF